MIQTRWGIAALAGALALATPALAQTQAGSQMGTGGQRDTQSGTSRDTDSNTPGSASDSSMRHEDVRDQGTGTADTRAAATGGKSAKLDKGLLEAAEKLHADNQGEIQAGQVALQSAQSSEVKSFAQQMVDDHGKNDQKLQQLADSMGVQLTGDAFQKEQRSGQKDMQKLQEKQGAEFDKAYMKQMVSDHKKDIKEVSKAAKDAHKKNQAELASFLDQTHTGMTHHLQEAERIEKSLGKGGPQAGTSHPSSSGTGSSDQGSSNGSSGSGTSPEKKGY
jgi:putative membrane protein